MKIQITSVNMQYDEEGSIDRVRVHFTGRNGDRTVNLSGYVPLTPEEYDGNESVPKLEGIVRKSMIEELQSEPEESPES